MWKVSDRPGCPRGGGVGRSLGGERREQPPSFNNSLAVPGLAEEEASPRAGGEETESEGAGRRWAPPAAARQYRVRGRAEDDTGERKLRWRLARPVAGLSWVPIVVEARCFALGFEVLSVCRSSAAARSVRSAVRPGSASAFGGSVALWRTGFFDLRFLRLSRAPAGRDASHLGVSLTSVPLASPMALSQGRLPRRSRAGESHLRRGSRRPPLGPDRELDGEGGGSRPPPSTSVRVCFPLR